MTCSPDLPRRAAADARRTWFVVVPAAVCGDRLDDFGVRTPLPDGARNRMRDDARVDAGARDYTGMRVPIGFRCVEITRRRDPRRQLEDVGKRPDCLHVQPEIGLWQLDDELWRGCLKRSPHSRERGVIGRLSPDQRTHGPHGYRTHTDRTPTR